MLPLGLTAVRRLITSGVILIVRSRTDERDPHRILHGLTLYRPRRRSGGGAPQAARDPAGIARVGAVVRRPLRGVGGRPAGVLEGGPRRPRRAGRGARTGGKGPPKGIVPWPRQRAGSSPGRARPGGSTWAIIWGRFRTTSPCRTTTSASTAWSIFTR